MKTNVKKALILLLVMLTVVLSGCGEKPGIKKAEDNVDGTHTAYYYLRKVENEKQYCLSLLKKDEELVMEDEPNLYVSDMKFDFEWSEDILCVVLNEKDETLKDAIEIDNILVAFGH